MTSGTLRPSLPLAPLRRWKAMRPDASGAGMSSDLFQTVRDGLQPRLADVLTDIPAGRADRRQGILLRVSGGRTGELLPHQSAKRRRQRLCHRRTLVGHHQPCRAMLKAAPRRGGTRSGPAVCAFSGLRNNVFPCASASLYAPVACASFSAGAAASAWTAGDVYAALALSGCVSDASRSGRTTMRRAFVRSVPC